MIPIGLANQVIAAVIFEVAGQCLILSHSVFVLALLLRKQLH